MVLKVRFDTVRSRAMEGTLVWSALARAGEQTWGGEDPREMDRLAGDVVR